MEPTHRFLRACLRLPVDRTPVWLMRQAGRYLPQYRAVRARASFLELLGSPDLATEVTLQPLDEYPLDAAILFSDILVPLQAMGLHLEFTEEGPSLARVTDDAGVDRLQVPDPEDRMPYVLETVRRIRRAINGRVPLIGFAGAPFTLASYAVEGGGSKSYAALKRMMFGAPRTAHRLLDKIAETVALSLEAQVAAGAQAVQLFDSWAGILSPADYEEFALRPARAVIDRLRASRRWHEAPEPVPIIYFLNGAAPYLELLAGSGADVIGLDFRIDIGVARARLGPGLAVQGNLDPGALFLPAETIAERARDIIRKASAWPGHVFNLGHGVLPETDPERVRALVAAVQAAGGGSAA